MPTLVSHRAGVGLQSLCSQLPQYVKCGCLCVWALRSSGSLPSPLCRGTARVPGSNGDWNAARIPFLSLLSQWQAYPGHLPERLFFLPQGRGMVWAHLRVMMAGLRRSLCIGCIYFQSSPVQPLTWPRKGLRFHWVNR